MVRRVVMLQVVEVGRCCGGLNYLGVCLGQRLNLTWLKLRILGWIMDRQTCSNCTYKLILLSTNENQCFEKDKTLFENLTKMFMFPYRSDFVEWTWRWFCCRYDWFRMLWRHSNTVYGRNISCVCGGLWRIWYWYVIGKSGTVGEGPSAGRVRFRGSSQWGIGSGEY